MRQSAHVQSTAALTHHVNIVFAINYTDCRIRTHVVLDSLTCTASFVNAAAVERCAYDRQVHIQVQSSELIRLCGQTRCGGDARSLAQSLLLQLLLLLLLLRPLAHARTRSRWAVC